VLEWSPAGCVEIPRVDLAQSHKLTDAKLGLVFREFSVEHAPQRRVRIDRRSSWGALHIGGDRHHSPVMASSTGVWSCVPPRCSSHDIALVSRLLT
jgi:hypothetical protein